MFGSIKDQLTQELAQIDSAGLYKRERIISSPQDAEITLSDGSTVLNFCANNYLGLSSHPRVVDAAKKAIDTHGFGMSSVRFICGTQDIHKELEKRIADFHHTEDTILYAAAFDANGGVFEPLLGAEDAIISDSLNHASIIDGVRLCKARRYRYANNDMVELEACLKQAKADGARHMIVVTDGVFSMDGYVAQIDKICDLADAYEAMVMVDECHATGFIGPTGRGSIELRNAMGRVDIITGTLGKAMGGAMGGFTTGKQEIIDMLRQRSRPYLFSNSLAPSIVGASIEVFNMFATRGSSTLGSKELQSLHLFLSDAAVIDKKVRARCARAAFLCFCLPSFLLLCFCLPSSLRSALSTPRNPASAKFYGCCSPCFLWSWRSSACSASALVCARLPWRPRSISHGCVLCPTPSFQVPQAQCTSLATSVLL